MQVDVEIGKDQPFADPLPDDPGHLVAVKFDDRVGYLDLAHVAAFILGESELQRALGKAARLINGRGGTCAVPYPLSVTGAHPRRTAMSNIISSNRPGAGIKWQWPSIHPEGRKFCLLYTSPRPPHRTSSRMPPSA